MATITWFPGNIHNSYHNSNQANDVMASKYDILLKAIKKKTNDMVGHHNLN